MKELIRSIVVPGLIEFKLPADDQRLDILEQWLKALIEYNSHVNVIGTEDPAEILTKHVLDSLSALPYFAQGSEVLDIGSGAGFPGMLLALFGNLKVTVNESKDKKCAFLKQGAEILKPFQVKVYQGNAAEVKGRFQIITARAFAETSKIIKLTRKQLAPNGMWLLYKGTSERIAEETAALDQTKIEKIALKVPGLEAERHLLRIKP